MRRWLAFGALALAIADVGVSAAATPARGEFSAPVPGTQFLGTVRAHAAASGLGDLLYGGGPVQSAPKVYLIFWGSQWSSDPSGEAGILTSFFNGAGGSTWLSTVNQYCSPAASNPPCSESTNLSLAGVWSDASKAPHRPRQSQLAAEAARGSAHFGDNSVNAQFVVATAHNNNSSGFGSQYCAYHSTTTANGATISWTNLPYITDAGASCGANFNGLGPNAGITIVAGHESAESITDPQPSSGWVDLIGEENGDKCAWITTGSQGAVANTTLSTGTFPVQSTYSNAISDCPNVP